MGEEEEGTASPVHHFASLMQPSMALHVSLSRKPAGIMEPPIGDALVMIHRKATLLRRASRRGA